jgi:hypothetical protein
MNIPAWFHDLDDRNLIAPDLSCQISKQWMQ